MPKCAFCGKQIAKGSFCQGHDQSYRTETAKKIGGDIPLRELVEEAQQYASGLKNLTDFSDVVRRLFFRK